MSTIARIVADEIRRQWGRRRGPPCLGITQRGTPCPVRARWPRRAPRWCYRHGARGLASDFIASMKARSARAEWVLALALLAGTLLVGRMP